MEYGSTAKIMTSLAANKIIPKEERFMLPVETKDQISFHDKLQKTIQYFPELSQDFTQHTLPIQKNLEKLGRDRNTYAEYELQQAELNKLKGHEQSLKSELEAERVNLKKIAEAFNAAKSRNHAPILDELNQAQSYTAHRITQITNAYGDMNEALQHLHQKSTRALAQIGYAPERPGLQNDDLSKRGFE